MRVRLTILSLVVSFVTTLTAPGIASAAITTKKIPTPAGATGMIGPSQLYCWSAGNCMAAGTLQVNSLSYPWAAQEVNGTWKTPTKLGLPTTPGADLPVTIASLSCPSTGMCLLSASYSLSRSSTVAVKYEWYSAKWSGPSRLSLSGSDFTGDFTPRGPANQGLPVGGCWSDRNCVVTTYYQDKIYDWIGISAREINGTWTAAKRVVSPAPDMGGNIASAVDCITGSGCVSVGRFIDDNGTPTLFASTTTDGTWSAYTPIAAPANALSTEMISPSSLSCVSMTSCAMTGTYSTRASSIVQFTATETNGTWGAATQISMPAGYSQKDNPSSYTPPMISCSSDFFCVVSSWGYASSSGSVQRPMIAKGVDGIVATASPIQLMTNAITSSLSPAGITSLACGSANHCVVFGATLISGGIVAGFQVRENAGTWLRAEKVALPSDANTRYATPQVTSTFCVTPTSCVGSGYYSNTNEKDASFSNEGISV